MFSLERNTETFTRVSTRTIGFESSTNPALDRRVSDIHYHLDFVRYVLHSLPIGNFRSEDEDDYEYEFSVLSTRTSKNVGLQTLYA